MLWYGSRHYDPELGRFTQPDTIVPTSVQGVQAYDRFAYANNNPLRYTDPTGHWACDEQDENGKCINYEQIQHRLRRKFKDFKPFKTYGYDEMITTVFIDLPGWNETEELAYDEWKLFLNDSGHLDRVTMLRWGLIAKLAMNEAKRLFPGQFPDGTPRNAFQHAFAAALLSREFGSELALGFLNGHETGFGQAGANGLGTFMDRHNNSVGLSIGDANPYVPVLKLEELVLEALKNGEMVVLDVDRIKEGDYSANTIYPSNQCPQLCNYPQSVFP